MVEEVVFWLVVSTAFAEKIASFFLKRKFNYNTYVGPVYENASWNSKKKKKIGKDKITEPLFAN